MIKLHKIENGKLLYREAWAVDAEQKAVIHWGIVGRRGKSEEKVIEGISFDDFCAEFYEEAKELGYDYFPADQMTHVVVQYRMKSAKGTKRDNWLKDKVHEYLNDDLGWKGVGEVSHSELGEGTQEGFFRINIHCVVVNSEIGVAAAKSCLRESRLDLNQAVIATQDMLGAPYQIAWSKKKQESFVE